SAPARAAIGTREFYYPNIPDTRCVFGYNYLPCPLFPAEMCHSWVAESCSENFMDPCHAPLGEDSRALSLALFLRLASATFTIIISLGKMFQVSHKLV